MAEFCEISLVGEQGVGRLVVAVVGQLAFVETAGGDFRPRSQEGTGVDVETAPVALVGIVGGVVVLETVGDAVVVHVDAEKKLWSVHVVTQEGLFPVRLQIRPDQLDVVLVVVGDEVVVLVPPRKHETVGGVTGADALPINLPILVIVVVDGAGVTALHGQVRTRAVVRVHAVGFAEKKEGIGLA